MADERRPHQQRGRGCGRWAAWMVAFAAVGAVQWWSYVCEWRATHPVEWREARVEAASWRIDASIAAAEWPRCTAECWTGASLSQRFLHRINVGGAVCSMAKSEAMPGDLERFANEVQARFHGRVSGETVRWFMDRAGSPCPNAAASADFWRGTIVAELLFPMDSPLSREEQRFVDRHHDRICPKCEESVRRTDPVVGDPPADEVRGK